jgi:hypothetical protein
MHLEFAHRWLWKIQCREFQRRVFGRTAHFSEEHIAALLTARFLLVSCLIYSSALKMEAVCFSWASRFSELPGIRTQKTIIFTSEELCFSYRDYPETGPKNGGRGREERRSVQNVCLMCHTADLVGEKIIWNLLLTLANIRAEALKQWANVAVNFSDTIQILIQIAFISINKLQFF